MRILIRADEYPKIGSGHVMRMLALAQAFQACGDEVIYISAKLSDSFIRRLESEGIGWWKLPDVKIASEGDLASTLSFGEEFGCDWIVLDGYRFDYSYQAAIREAGFRLLWVDDCRFQERFCADLVLNSNLDVSDSSYIHLSGECGFLLGDNYCLLRKEFWDVECSKQKRRVSNRIRVIVTFGGSDPANATEAFLEQLKRYGTGHFDFRIILGSGYAYGHRLKAGGDLSLKRVSFLTNVQSMAEQYEWADAIVAAVGGTTWEWMRYELPAAVLPIADNQLPLVHSLVERKLATQIGFFEKGRVVVKSDLLSNWLESLVVQTNKKPFPIKIDGKGGKRVRKAMLQC